MGIQTLHVLLRSHIIQVPGAAPAYIMNRHLAPFRNTHSIHFAVNAKLRPIELGA